MLENEKKEESLFDKMIGLFGSNEQKNSELVEVEVSNEGFYEGLRTLFLEKEESDIIDVEAFEEITSDMELMVIVRDLDEHGEEITKQKLICMNELKVQKSILDILSDKAGSVFDTLIDTMNSSWEFTTNNLSSAKYATIEFSSSTADTLVHYTKQVEKKYDELELSPKFYSFINTIDLVVVITGIQILVEKQKKGSKEYIALSTIIGLLLLLDRSKQDMKKEMGFMEVNDKLNQDLSVFLKSITFKDVVETAEPILLIIPNGNYILLILKLFV